MKGTSTAYKTHRALKTSSGGQTTRQCLYVELKNGGKVYFTDHDRNIVIPNTGVWVGTGLNGTYLASSGFFSTANQTTSALNVDNTELTGPQVSPNILQADLLAGSWDHAKFIVFEVNWADLTMGPDYLRTGRMGEVTVEQGRFTAEVRGLTQEYTKTLCELTSPGCRADFGDARCRKDLSGLAVTGTLTGVNDDNTTVYDSSRAESGPSAGVAITAITNAASCQITLADASLNLIPGQAITIAGVVGMEVLNVVTVAYGVAGNVILLNTDTTDTAVWGTYVSGGTVTPFSGTGGTSGFFDGGKITFTSGLNTGLSQEVKSYVPGQITLALPMPFAAAVGDDYSLTPGCMKTPQACKAYSNYDNFVGEPDMRGLDQMLQVGRHA